MPEPRPRTPFVAEHLLRHARHDAALLPVAEHLGTFTLEELETAVADRPELRVNAVFWLASAEARGLVENQARRGGDLRDFSVVERTAGPSRRAEDQRLVDDRVLDGSPSSRGLPLRRRRRGD